MGRNLLHGCRQCLVLIDTDSSFPALFWHGSAPGYNVPVLCMCDSRDQAKTPAPCSHLGATLPHTHRLPHSRGRHSVQPLPRAEMTSCASKQGERFFQLRQAQPRNLTARRPRQSSGDLLPSYPAGRGSVGTEFLTLGSDREHHQ